MNLFGNPQKKASNQNINSFGNNKKPSKNNLFGTPSNKANNNNILIQNDNI